MAGLTSVHAKSDGQVSLACARGPEQDDVVTGVDEVEGAEMSDGLAIG